MNDMRFWYPASISQITSINDSFGSCVLRVCYAGRNRNRSFISKDAIERAVPTMAYCPIVANYDVESDVIGGHDVAFVENKDGDLKMVNLTDAVGVIPDNPQWYWETVTEEDGTERDYLCTPAILWKRTPVYDKLSRDGVSGQSMEIDVRDGKMVDGLFEIDSFEFTAFCLLGEDVEPCFESAQVELFSANKLQNRLSEMMDDFKSNFSKVMTASADDDISTPKGEKSCLEGGEVSLKMDELLQKYGLTAEDIDFDIDGMAQEDIEARFESIRAAKFDNDGGDDGQGEEDGQAGEDANEGQTGDNGDDQTGEQTGEPASDSQDGESEDDRPEEDDDDPEGARRQYSLTGNQLRDGILDALYTISYEDEWGTWPRYCFTDYDPSVNEVYAYDNEDWNLYGFKYTLNGDNVVIDFDSKTRKKLAFVDFDNGDAQFNYRLMFASANSKFEKIANEVVELRTFKNGVESDKRKKEEDNVFSLFADLADDERFKELRENCSDLSIQEIEDKCYAIRGRNVQVKFAKSSESVRLPVEGKGKNINADEPYNGVFIEFGIGNR